jgi:AraC-like DNA-binding protein
VGYASGSAFIAMYRRAYGEPPGQKKRRHDPGAGACHREEDA